MSGHEYQVILQSKQDAPARSTFAYGDTGRVVHQIQQKWPCVHFDNKALMARLLDNTGLVCEDDTYIFQLLLPNSPADGEMSVSLRFAYCNPETVVEPFCAMIEWLMTQYSLEAQPMRFADDADYSRMAERKIYDANLVRPILMPQMRILQARWHQAVGGRTAKLTPDEMGKYFADHSASEQI